MHRSPTATKARSGRRDRPLPAASCWSKTSLTCVSWPSSAWPVSALDVLAAESAELAQSLLNKEGPFDALVTDIMLPGCPASSWRTPSRRTHPRMPVLFMTAYAGSPTAPGMPGPDANLLRKPYRPDALRLRVAEMLREALQGSKR